MVTKELVDITVSALCILMFASIMSLYITCVSAEAFYKDKLLNMRPFNKIKNTHLRDFVLELVSTLPIINLYIIYLICKNVNPERTVFSQIKECETPDEMARILERLFEPSADGDSHVCINCTLKNRCDQDPALDTTIELTEDGAGISIDTRFECKNNEKYPQYSEAMQVLMSPELDDIKEPIWGIDVYKEQNGKVLENKVIFKNSKGKFFRGFKDARSYIDKQIKLFHLREFDDVIESRSGISACNLLNDKGVTTYKFFVVIASDINDAKVEGTERTIGFVVEEIKNENNRVKNARKTLFKEYLERVKEFFRRRAN